MHRGASLGLGAIWLLGLPIAVHLGAAPYRVSALYSVIGGAGKNCGGAVNLFAEHRPRQ